MQNAQQGASTIVALYQFTSIRQYKLAFRRADPSLEKLFGMRGEHSLAVIRWGTQDAADLFFKQMQTTLRKVSDPTVRYFQPQELYSRDGETGKFLALFQTEDKGLFGQAYTQAKSEEPCILLMGGEKIHQEDRWHGYEYHGAYKQHYLLIAVFSTDTAARKFAGGRELETKLYSML